MCHLGFIIKIYGRERDGLEILVFYVHVIHFCDDAKVCFVFDVDVERVANLQREVVDTIFLCSLFVIAIYSSVLLAEESLQMFGLFVKTLVDSFVFRIEWHVCVLANADLFVLEKVIGLRYIRPYAEPQHMPFFPLFHEWDVVILFALADIRLWSVGSPYRVLAGLEAWDADV